LRKGGIKKVTGAGAQRDFDLVERQASSPVPRIVSSGSLTSAPEGRIAGEKSLVMPSPQGAHPSKTGTGEAAKVVVAQKWLANARNCFRLKTQMWLTHRMSLGWYNGGMKEKTSITLSKEVLTGIDRIAGSTQSRSAFIEAVLTEYLRKRARQQVEARDLELINKAADELNAEVEDILRYQDPEA
jgi:Arc/MetJ family transcription regulator